MKSFLFAMFAALSFVLTVWAGDPSAATLSGTVTDGKSPLPDANISIPAVHQSTITNPDGKFVFENLPPGVYTLEISMVGYTTGTKTVHLTSGDVSLAIRLKSTPLELPGLTVTAQPQATDVFTSQQSVHVLEGRQLDRDRGQNIMKAIQNTPGVSLYTTGPGIAKPVIRGLTSQRVVVAQDGVRYEGQQWGDEHAPEIDPTDVKKIEVLRGPNSVLYGSDALGGVVNIVHADVPSSGPGGAPVFGGDLLLNGFSNNRQGSTALSVHGADGMVGYRGNLSLMKAGLVTTPAGKWPNSGQDEADGSGELGAKGDWGYLGVNYQHFYQRIQMYDNPADNPGGTPYQKVMHDLVHVHADFPSSTIHVEADAGWQRDNRREFETADAVDPSLNLLLHTTTLDVKAHHQPFGPVSGTFGVSVMNQQNQTLGEEKLIPAFNEWNLAGFVYESADLKALNLAGGLRFDTRSMDVQASPDLHVAAQTRDYNAVSGSAGLSWRASDVMDVAFNVGRGWRAPTEFELFADGVHEGTGRFEIGDSTMVPEVSLNTDMSVRYLSSRAQGEVSFFRNRINHYIYPDPTGQKDPASGFPIYRNRQADATLVGGEFSVQGQTADWLVLNAGVDVVRGTNDATGNPLPLMPPYRLKLGARFTVPSWRGISNPYFSLHAKFVAAQNRVAPQEEPTAGYNLFGVGLGGEIPAGRQKATVDLAVENLFNTAYRDHLSRLRDYALNPGRDITLKVSIPFGE